VQKFVVTTIALAVCSLSFAADTGKPSVNAQAQAEAASAQNLAAQAALRGPFATSTCSFTFTSGANDTFLKYCVTANGNIAQLETPQGHEHIAVGAFGEGYGLCDATVGSAEVPYFDYADFGDSSNWLPATLVTQSPTVVKIVRSTADGIWTLTQTITQMAGTSPSVKVAMSIKNNTVVDRHAFLIRYADVDANGFFFNSLGATANSAFAWDPTISTNIAFRGNFGLSLQAHAIPQAQAPNDRGPQAFTQNTPNGPPPCSVIFNFVPNLDPADDGSVVTFYELGVPKRASRTVTVHYKGM